MRRWARPVNALFWPDMGVVLLAVLAMVTVKSADVKAQDRPVSRYESDFVYIWQTFRDEYAYFR